MLKTGRTCVNKSQYVGETEFFVNYMGWVKHNVMQAVVDLSRQLILMTTWSSFVSLFYILVFIEICRCTTLELKMMRYFGMDSGTYCNMYTCGEP